MIVDVVLYQYQRTVQYAILKIICTCLVIIVIVQNVEALSSNLFPFSVC